MSKSVVLTSSGVVKAGSGEIYSIQITKQATGAGSVQVYDNPSTNTGNVMWQGDGLFEGDYDCTDTNGTGLITATGIYVQLAGTTNATVVVIYN